MAELISEIQRLRTQLVKLERGETVPAIGNRLASGFHNLGGALVNNTWNIIPCDSLTPGFPAERYVGGLFVVPSTGIYWVAGSVALVFEPDTNSFAIGGIWKNEGEALRGTRISAAAGIANEYNVLVTGFIHAIAGDKLELRCYVSSNHPVSVEVGGEIENRLDVMWVGV